MRKEPERSYYAVKREGQGLAIMHMEDGLDPHEEASKAGPVIAVTPISEAEAAAIKATRPALSKPEATEQPVAVPSEAIHAEFDAIRAEIESIKQAISPEMRADIASLKKDVSQIIDGLKQIYHENKAVIEGKV